MPVDGGLPTVTRQLQQTRLLTTAAATDVQVHPLDEFVANHARDVGKLARGSGPEASQIIAHAVVIVVQVLVGLRAWRMFRAAMGIIIHQREYARQNTEEVGSCYVYAVCV